MSNESPVQPSAVVQEPRGTFGFERKVSLGNYESAVASIYVQFPIDLDDDEATLRSAKDAAFIAKTVVFDQLDIPVEYDTERGVLREVIGKLFGAVEVVPTPDATPQQAQQVVRSQPRPTNSDKPSCPRCGGDMWDNRKSKTNSRQPDYRCKNYKPADGGCEGVIWPPKGGK